jgi:hypothetical protein
MTSPALYCLSEYPRIEIFEPFISPRSVKWLSEEVVIAISSENLSNYLFPPDCPRIVIFPLPKSSELDCERFLGPAKTGSVIAVEAKWFDKIQQTTLYCYQVPEESFMPLERNDSFYVSFKSVKPISVKPVYNPLGELMKRNIEIRFLPSLDKLLNEIIFSTIGYSLIEIENCECFKNQRRSQTRISNGYSIHDDFDQRIGIRNFRTGNGKKV